MKKVKTVEEEAMSELTTYIVEAYDSEQECVDQTSVDAADHKEAAELGRVVFAESGTVYSTIEVTNLGYLDED